MVVPDQMHKKFQSVGQATEIDFIVRCIKKERKRKEK